jgi:formyl-CoA transferase
MGVHKGGVPLWWKVQGRNKRSITLDLHKPEGRDILRRLAKDADVLIENFRPGRMEKWGLGWENLAAINPRLIMVRVTGFGQTGPYKNRPGFGSLAEAISGCAHITGAPDGPPILPPFGLADGVAAQYALWATMFAIYERDVGGSGKGQVIDVSLYEPLFSLLGYQSTLYDQLGVIQGRTGSRSIHSAPRNNYRTRDGRWVALSTNTPSIVDRVMRLTGGDAFADDPRFATGAGRVKHVDEIDAVVGGWIAERTLDEVIAAFEQAEGAVAPVYDIGQIFEDPHYRARNDIVSVPDPDLGSFRMQNVFPFLSRTPGRIRHSGPAIGEHTREVLGELGLSDADIDQLAANQVI